MSIVLIGLNTSQLVETFEAHKASYKIRSLSAYGEALKVNFAGDTHAALDRDHRAIIWGNALRGERGAGVSTLLPAHEPSIVPGLPPISQSESGGSITLVLDDSGRAAWWGGEGGEALGQVDFSKTVMPPSP